MEFINVVILGGPQVGKRNLLVQFANSWYIPWNGPDHQPDTPDNRSKIFDLPVELLGRNGLPYQQLRIWFDITKMQTDPAGTAIEEQVFGNADAIIMLYSATDRASLDCLFEKREMLTRRAQQRMVAQGGASGDDETGFTMMLVGNKTDLLSERDVTEDEGRAVAKSWGVSYAECSARTAEGVDAAFGKLAIEALRHRGGVLRERSAGQVTSLNTREKRFSVEGLKRLLKRV